MIEFCFYCLNPKMNMKCEICCKDSFDVIKEVQKQTQFWSVSPLPLGTMLRKKFLIGRPLGSGGFGITYIAFDTQLKRKVAIKELCPMKVVHREQNSIEIMVTEGLENRFSRYIEKFLDEASRLGELTNVSNVIDILDYFEENQSAYIVMKYLEGMTLQEYVDSKKGKIGIFEAVQIITNVMDALELVHDKGMIHRDIKPANIYLKDNTNEVVLIDFGASRYAIRDNLDRLTVIYSPGFGAPEQEDSRSSQGAWTDVYGVGATLYYLLTGQQPHPDLTPEEVSRRFPAILSEQICKSLRKNINERYLSIKDFKGELLKNRLVELKPFDYVQFGYYENQPIVWRVIEKDDDGDLLLFCAKILKPKEFDSSGNYHTSHDRREYGSSYYPDSNVRQWLNSSVSKIEWIQNEPTYRLEKGFLADGNFTSVERELIKPFTQKNDLKSAYLDVGRPGKVTDLVFLPDINTVKKYENTTILSAIRTQREMEIENEILSNNHKSDYWKFKNILPVYWLRNPCFVHGEDDSVTCTSYEKKMKEIGGYSEFGEEGAGCSIQIGVRPSLYIYSHSYQITNGEGTAENPFLIFRGEEQILMKQSEEPVPPYSLQTEFDHHGRLKLSWKYNKRTGERVSFQVYQDHVLIQTVTDNFCYIDDLTLGKKYSFEIKTKDDLNRSSNLSERISIVPKDDRIINIGDYIRFGKYKDKCLVWLVVHHDDDGDPLLLLNTVLEEMNFSSGNDYEHEFWPVSIARQWLNSSDDYINWIFDKYTSIQSGFLCNSNFSKTERSLIKQYAHDVIVGNEFKVFRDGTKATYLLNDEGLNSSDNFELKQCDFIKVRDFVFLLTSKEVYDMVVCRGISPFAIGHESGLNELFPFLPMSSVDENGNVSNKYDIVHNNGFMYYCDEFGLRPALYLDLSENKVQIHGNGTLNHPFEIEFENKTTKLN